MSLVSSSAFGGFLSRLKLSEASLSYLLLTFGIKRCTSVFYEAISPDLTRPASNSSDSPPAVQITQITQITSVIRDRAQISLLKRDLA